MQSTLLPRRTALPMLARRPGEFLRTFRWPLLVLAIGATADVVTTYRNLRLYGTGVEAHIVQRWVSDVVGIHVGVPLAKVIQLGFVLFVAAWWRPWTAVMLVLCAVLYGAAATSNHFLWI
ncbi:MAG: hypothetical protein ACAI43_03330 [Phycisphaerae bacterium]